MAIFTSSSGVSKLDFDCESKAFALYCANERIQPSSVGGLGMLLLLAIVHMFRNQITDIAFL
ncbi:hypothetical protein U27_04684 [Candidatus Vecturithrix granuli]|uniref:Uncharacterized protein n=1 Tax=Vecturithrix granuli TaxID=1499967 RepID=A0A081BZG2_VECG1|nr:hypothetical protein U27_04684 [Candidatus Vecturithrix granuli]